MASHPVDFLLIGNNFSTPEMRAIWHEENRLRQQVNVEIALARAQGELGVIPRDAAQDILHRARPDALSLQHIAGQAAQMKHSFMPTLSALQEQCGDAGEYLHYGATTQDIVDTGTVLQLRDALTIIRRDARKVA